MLEFLCIAGVPGRRNVFSLAPGTIMSLPAEESHGCGSPPSPTAYPKEKKILTPGFWKSPTDSSGLINSGLIHYWEIGPFLLKPGKTAPMIQR